MSAELLGKVGPACVSRGWIKGDPAQPSQSCSLLWLGATQDNWTLPYSRLVQGLLTARDSSADCLE